jgi:glycosyltransferase involved in cell wall biosynthesis
MPTQMEAQGLVQPLVSVVIPYFNDGAYIDEAVDSILAQTYQNTEIIIVNDGSTDPHSVEKIRNYQRPRTRVVHHSANQHLSAARNTGFREAKSEYVLTLDADDMFEATFIEKAAKILDTLPEVGAVSAWVEGFGASSFKWTHLVGGGLENFTTQNNSVACALIRKQAWEQVGGYDENMKHGYEDWEFWINLTSRHWRVHLIQEYLFKYRQKSQSMLNDTQTKHTDIYEYIIHKHQEALRPFWIKIVVEQSRHIRHLVSLTNQKEHEYNLLDKELNSVINKIYGSFSYRLGNLAAQPLSKAKKALAKLMSL